MLTIKDFQKGDKAYKLTRNQGRNTEPCISEVTIVSVGRIYVTVKENLLTTIFTNWNSDYLHEKVEYGEPDLLFKTEESAKEYIEKQELALWIGTISVRKAETYTLEQLRKVKNILEN